MVKNIATFFICATFLTGCSLYQSDGRKDVEENTNDIIGPAGFVPSGAMFYVCMQSKNEPSFLKEPFEVVATPYDSEKFTTLFDAVNTPSTVIVYTVTEQNVYAYCHVTSTAAPSRSHQKLTAKKIQAAAQVGVEEIRHMLNPPAPNS
jgi:hypothetical protein